MTSSTHLVYDSFLTCSPSGPPRSVRYFSAVVFNSGILADAYLVENTASRTSACNGNSRSSSMHYVAQASPQLVLDWIRRGEEQERDAPAPVRQESDKNLLWGIFIRDKEHTATLSSSAPAEHTSSTATPTSPSNNNNKSLLETPGSIPFSSQSRLAARQRMLVQLQQQQQQFEELGDHSSTVNALPSHSFLSREQVETLVAAGGCGSSESSSRINHSDQVWTGVLFLIDGFLSRHKNLFFNLCECQWFAGQTLSSVTYRIALTKLDDASVPLSKKCEVVLSSSSGGGGGGGAEISAAKSQQKSTKARQQQQQQESIESLVMALEPDAHEKQRITKILANLTTPVSRLCRELMAPQQHQHQQHQQPAAVNHVCGKFFLLFCPAEHDDKVSPTAEDPSNKHSRGLHHQPIDRFYDELKNTYARATVGSQKINWKPVHLATATTAPTNVAHKNKNSTHSLSKTTATHSDRDKSSGDWFFVGAQGIQDPFRRAVAKFLAQQRPDRLAVMRMIEEEEEEEVAAARAAAAAAAREQEEKQKRDEAAAARRSPPNSSPFIGGISSPVLRRGAASGGDNNNNDCSSNNSVANQDDDVSWDAEVHRTGGGSSSSANNSRTGSADATKKKEGDLSQQRPLSPTRGGGSGRPPRPSSTSGILVLPADTIAMMPTVASGDSTAVVAALSDHSGAPTRASSAGGVNNSLLPPARSSVVHRVSIVPGALVLPDDNDKRLIQQRLTAVDSLSQPVAASRMSIHDMWVWRLQTGGPRKAIVTAGYDRSLMRQTDHIRHKTDLLVSNKANKKSNSNNNNSSQHLILPLIGAYTSTPNKHRSSSHQLALSLSTTLAATTPPPRNYSNHHHHHHHHQLSVVMTTPAAAASATHPSSPVAHLLDSSSSALSVAAAHVVMTTPAAAASATHPSSPVAHLLDSSSSALSVAAAHHLRLSPGTTFGPVPASGKKLRQSKFVSRLSHYLDTEHSRLVQKLLEEETERAREAALEAAAAAAAVEQQARREAELKARAAEGRAALLAAQREREAALNNGRSSRSKAEMMRLLLMRSAASLTTPLEKIKQIYDVGSFHLALESAYMDLFSEKLEKTPQPQAARAAFDGARSSLLSPLSSSSLSASPVAPPTTTSRRQVRLPSEIRAREAVDFFADVGIMAEYEVLKEDDEDGDDDCSGGGGDDDGDENNEGVDNTDENNNGGNSDSDRQDDHDDDGGIDDEEGGSKSRRKSTKNSSSSSSRHTKKKKKNKKAQNKPTPLQLALANCAPPAMVTLFVPDNSRVAARLLASTLWKADSIARAIDKLSRWQLDTWWHMFEHGSASLHRCLDLVLFQQQAEEQHQHQHAHSGSNLLLFDDDESETRTNINNGELLQQPRKEDDEAARAAAEEEAKRKAEDVAAAMKANAVRLMQIQAFLSDEENKRGRVQQMEQTQRALILSMEHDHTGFLKSMFPDWIAAAVVQRRREQQQAAANINNNNDGTGGGGGGGGFFGGAANTPALGLLAQAAAIRKEMDTQQLEERQEAQSKEEMRRRDISVQEVDLRIELEKIQGNGKSGAIHEQKVREKREVEEKAQREKVEAGERLLREKSEAELEVVLREQQAAHEQAQRALEETADRILREKQGAERKQSELEKKAGEQRLLAEHQERGRLEREQREKAEQQRVARHLAARSGKEPTAAELAAEIQQLRELLLCEIVLRDEAAARAWLVQRAHLERILHLQSAFAAAAAVTGGSRIISFAVDAILLPDLGRDRVVESSMKDPLLGIVSSSAATFGHVCLLRDTLIETTLLSRETLNRCAIENSFYSELQTLVLPSLCRVIAATSSASARSSSSSISTNDNNNSILIVFRRSAILRIMAAERIFAAENKCRTDIAVAAFTQSTAMVRWHVMATALALSTGGAGPPSMLSTQQEIRDEIDRESNREQPSSPVACSPRVVDSAAATSAKATADEVLLVQQVMEEMVFKNREAAARREEWATLWHSVALSCQSLLA